MSKINVGDFVKWNVGRGRKSFVKGKVLSTTDSLTPQGIKVVATEDVKFKPVSRELGKELTVKKGEILHPYHAVIDKDAMMKKHLQKR